NPIPNSTRVLNLVSPGKYPKFASAEIISGESYPPAWQDSLVTCDFRANRVTRFSIEDQDAGFVTKQEDDLMRSSSSSFRPIDVKQGPDGALYVADWSNPIINHGEVDFRDERRDRWHGRIWRVTWKGAKAKPIEDLTELDNKTLLMRLTSDDRYTRDQARRVLLERGDQIAADVHLWIWETDNELSKLQGVWLQQALGRVLPTDLKAILSSKDPNVRAAAIRIVNDLADPETDQSQPLDMVSSLRILTDAVNDNHPRVRLEAVRAFGNLGTAAAAAGALQAIDHPRDRFIDFALATTMDELTDPFMAALESGAWTLDTPQSQKQLEFALTSIEPSRAASYLSEQIASNAIPADGSGPWIELIGKAGGKAELTKLLEQVIAGGFDTDAMTRAVNAISEAQRLRKQRPTGDLRRISKLFQSDSESLAIAAIRLAGNWRLGAQVESLTDVAKNAKSETLRETATQALREIGKPAVAALTELAESTDKAIRASSVIALASLDPNLAAKSFYRVLADAESENDALMLWRGVLTTSGAAKALAKNLPGDGVSENAARAGLMAARDGGRQEPELVAALTPHANNTMKAEDLTPQRVGELIELVRTEGDPVRGERVYSRAELQCINCHAIGGVGGKVGPDMTSLGASAPIDYLIESIYLPNAKIKENYHSVNVLTVDGQVVNGIVVESSDDELVLRNVSNQLVRIPRDDIEFEKAGQSMMPQGVVDRLTAAEQVDLISFLTQLGRPGEFDASQGGVARFYDVLAGTHRIEQGGGSQRIISGQMTEGWKPLMSRVNGMVPSGMLTEMTKQQVNISLIHVYLRTKIQMSNDGEMTLHAEGGKPVDLWIDGAAVEGKTSFTTSISAGEHTVLIRLDARDLPEQFRLVSNDVTFVIE
ncbi:MAG: HEAT repeat domain-containing protein, partial [Rubripirellula sp.]